MSVAEALFEFLDADSWQEKRPVLEASLELLTQAGAVEEHFSAAIASAAKANAARAVRQLDQHRDILRRLRAQGPSVFFAQMDTGTDPNVPDDLVELVQQTIVAFNEHERTDDQAHLRKAAVTCLQVIGHIGLVEILPSFQVAALRICFKVLLRQYELYQSMDDLDLAIYVSDLAVPQIHTDRHSLGTALAKSSLVLFERFQKTDNINDLQLALIDGERALRVAQLAGLEYTLLAAHLAKLLKNRYELLKSKGDLDDAIALYSVAVAETSEGEPELAEYLSGLGNCLLLRYQVYGDDSDLDQAVDMLGRAASSCMGDPVERTNHYSNLANAYTARFELKRQGSDLNNAIHALRVAVDSCPSVALGRWTLYERLAANLRDRYHLAHNLKDLNSAIDTLRQLEILLPDNYELRTFLDELGSRLWERFHHTGNLGDLEEAISVFERALAITKSDAPNYASALNNLGAALRDHYKYAGAEGDLERAIELHRQSTAVTPRDSHERAAHLNNLGIVLITAGDRSNDPSYFIEAVEVLREAVQLTNVNAIEYAQHLNNLGNAFLSRYQWFGDAADLDKAITTFAAARTHSMNRPAINSPSYINNLAFALKTRHERTGNPNDLDQAVACFRSCLKTWKEGGWGFGGNIVFVGDLWGQWALERGAEPEVEEAYSHVADGLRWLFQSQLLREHKEVRLGQTVGIAARAAYALARTKHVMKAVEVIESGKSLLLSERLDLRPPELKALLGNKEAEGLYQEYQDAAQHVIALQRDEPEIGQAVSGVGNSAFKLQAAAFKLEGIITRIRTIPGLERFLQPMSVAEIADLAGNGALVYFVTSLEGGLGLIVRGDASVTPLWLDELTVERVREVTQDYADGYNASEQDERRWLEALENTCEWLWHDLMAPLADNLKDCSQAVIIPTGLLALLPLHAASTSDDRTPTKKRFALDELQLSYAPNARSLLAAKQTLAEVVNPGVLVIDNPVPVRATPLLYSQYEAQAAGAATPGLRTLRLRNRQATLEAVLEAIPNYSVLHFSCHGIADFRNPLESNLLLANNQKLTMRAVMDLQLVGIQLVVLSACESSLPGIRLIDEAISLPSGFLQAGVAGVIGSLWIVFEPSTMELIVRFYDLWRSGRTIADALRMAQQQVRDTTVEQKRRYLGERLIGFVDPWQLLPSDALVYASPHYWAGFAHIGM